MNNLPRFYQKSKSAARGFAPKRLSLAERHKELSEAIAHWNKKKTLAAMAVINGIVYAVASQAEVLSMDIEGVRHVHRGRLGKLIKTGCRFLKTTIMGLKTYVETHWSIAPSHRIAIRDVRDSLHELGLIKAVKTYQGCASWSVFLDIDFSGLLAFYEILENALLGYWGMSFDELPSHKGALIKMFYDAASFCFGRRYRRELPDAGTKEEETESETVNHTEEQQSCHTQHPTSPYPTHNEPNSSSDSRECGVLISVEEMSRLADL